MLGAEERAREVHVEHPLPFGAIEHVGRAAARDSRRGDDRVDATVFGDHAVDHRRDRVLVPYVGLRERDLRRARRQVELGRGLGEIDAHDPRALGREPGYARQPDPRGGAGYQCELAVQSTHDRFLVRRPVLMESDRPLD